MIIAAIILVLFVAILALAWTRPDTIRIERTADIHTSPERVFGLLNDFHNWPAWSPQDKMDATMTRTYSGEPSGLGAVSEWQSKGQAGCGHMKIIESLPPHKITVQVDFMKPFRVCNINEFTLQGSEEVTKVRWALRGGSPFLLKLMSLFFNMKRMFGKHVESGLDNLKRLAETSH